MKYRLIPVLLLVWAFNYSTAQSALPLGGGDGARIWGDGQAAQQYAAWAKQAIEQGRWSEALAGLERAADFANVSSDISYLLAVARSHENKKRSSVVEALDLAIDINRWVFYDENHALLLKARQLIAMRKYNNAVECLNEIGQNVLSTDMEFAADSAMARLLALRKLAENPGGSGGMNPAQALINFQNFALSTMERFPRDPRPLRIFFDHANDSRARQVSLTQRDMELLDLALRRLPFLLETDPELAWTAAFFMRDIEEARRLVAAYRSGGFHIYNRDFVPSAGSVSAALNLGLMGDIEAVEELFSGRRGFNSPLPSNVQSNGEPVLEKNVILDVYNSLGSGEGRSLFTQKLHSFSGLIISGDDHDDFIDGHYYYRSGVIKEAAFDSYYDNVFDLRISFSSDGVPVSAEVPVTGLLLQAHIQWERYPSVIQASLAQERFMYRPAEFQFAPVSFTTIGGSASHAGLAFPVLSSHYSELTRRTLVLYSENIQRPSVEFNGAAEQIFLDKGIPLYAVEILNGNQVSATEFERGAPVLQYVDLDLDGRMETVRYFHNPGPDYLWPDSELKFDYRRLIASSESDWTGEGKYKTGEIYLQDGSVVYSWDMDGSGFMNYFERKDGN